MSYVVKEIVYTLQGEGANSGRAAVFCRFAGCNLWSGYEADRATATCRFCDTDFVGADGPGGGRFESPQALAAAVLNAWAPNTPDVNANSGTTIDRGKSKIENRKSKITPAEQTESSPAKPLVVFTGGEPALQLDGVLIDALHANNFEIAIETNGTLELPGGIDWVCVSPKAGTTLKVTAGDELKLIHPQPGAEPERYERLPFRHFFLQPMDGPDREASTRATVAYCLNHPRWRVSLQTHKILGLP